VLLITWLEGCGVKKVKKYIKGSSLETEVRDKSQKNTGSFLSWRSEEQKKKVRPASRTLHGPKLLIRDLLPSKGKGQDREGVGGDSVEAAGVSFDRISCKRDGKGKTMEIDTDVPSANEPRGNFFMTGQSPERRSCRVRFATRGLLA